MGAQCSPDRGVCALALLVPLVSNDYWVLIATRAAIYWVLVAGLNLMIGFAGQLAIGYVALLTLGAYTTSVLAAGNVDAADQPLPRIGGGRLRGCPVRRDCRTSGIATAHVLFCDLHARLCDYRHPGRARLAERDRWRHRAAGPGVSCPLDTHAGFYFFCLGIAAFCTWMTVNIAQSRFGRALIAVRDADVAAEASGISKPRLLVTVFLFCGALAAIAGGLFATLQTYITPDAFTFDLSVLFFIAVLIGGRGSILGPLHRHHHSHAAAGICSTAGGVVDLPLCVVAAGHRACGPWRHRGLARFQEPQALGDKSRDRSSAGLAERGAPRRMTQRGRSSSATSC